MGHLAETFDDGVVEIVDEGSGRLVDLDFTDIYISARGDARIRGSTTEAEPLVDVPGEYVHDIERLRQAATTSAGRRDEFALEFDSIPFRVSKMQAQEGEVLVFRRLLKEIPHLSRIGLFPMAQRYLHALGQGSGLILVSGPTGSGKTTTVGSILQAYLNRLGNVAVTIEDPPELPLEGRYQNGHCYQLQVENGDFSTPLKKALRYRPKYILVGEIRDASSASELLRAAQSGHVCLATIHSSSIEQALTSLLKYVASDLNLALASHMLASSIGAVINQRIQTTRVNDRIRHRAMMRTLFFKGNERGLRAYVRDNNIAALQNEILRQAALIEADKDPFPPLENVKR